MKVSLFAGLGCLVVVVGLAGLGYFAFKNLPGLFPDMDMPPELNSPAVLKGDGFAWRQEWMPISPNRSDSRNCGKPFRKSRAARLPSSQARSWTAPPR